MKKVKIVVFSLLTISTFAQKKGPCEISVNGEKKKYKTEIDIRRSRGQIGFGIFFRATTKGRRNKEQLSIVNYNSFELAPYHYIVSYEPELSGGFPTAVTFQSKTNKHFSSRACNSEFQTTFSEIDKERLVKISAVQITEINQFDKTISGLFHTSLCNAEGDIIEVDGTFNKVKFNLSNPQK